MRSSPNSTALTLMQQPQTVFKVTDIALLTGDTNPIAIVQRMAYALKKKLFVSPRRGVYAKHGYSFDELACRLFVPSYLSLEHILQRAGVIFQYGSETTMVSYLNRTIDVDSRTISYRKIKDEILINPAGIRRGIVNEATTERAFLDMLYLNANCHFDNPAAIDKDTVIKLLPIYNSPTLSKRALKILDNA